MIRCVKARLSGSKFTQDHRKAEISQPSALVSEQVAFRDDGGETVSDDFLPLTSVGSEIDAGGKPHPPGSPRV